MRKTLWSGLLAWAGMALMLGMGGAAAPATGQIGGKVTDERGAPLGGVNVRALEAGTQAVTGSSGRYKIVDLTPRTYTIKASRTGYGTETKRVTVSAGKVAAVNFSLRAAGQPPKPAEAAEEVRPPPQPRPLSPAKMMREKAIGRPMPSMMAPTLGALGHPPSKSPPSPGQSVRGDGTQPLEREGYDKIAENPFVSPLEEPLSTFSIDVDTAAYSNMRRFIEQENRWPPKDAVRIEELLNYFTYDYPDASGPDPFSVMTEVSDAPWNRAHRLIHIGIQGKKVAMDDLPPSNLVFLMDVSGSMNSPDKLPLLKAAFRLLVNQLGQKDRVAIAVYAGAAGLVLPSAPGSDKGRILAAIDRLRAGGSTAGGAGIRLAYRVAIDNFIQNGNNRIILATDGDFNVGASSDGELVRMIEEKRRKGVFLTILGFGRGNYQDAKMEKLSNAGNGNAAYIDSILEAKKVLVTEMGGTLLTIAKDVKIQIEFNPTKVKGYRLIGYENRMLRAQDFNDDKKDAGELGAGHSVTVLYEIVPAGSKETVPGIDDLKYQKADLSAAARSSELMTVKLRYKKPDGNKSELIALPLVDKQVPLNNASIDFRFSAAVAELGLLLRDSRYKGAASFKSVLERAKAARGTDDGGYRHDFIKLVEKASLLGGR